MKTQTQFSRTVKTLLYAFMAAALMFNLSCSPENGVDGINGIDGEQGPQGDQGPAGQDGEDGTDGQDGEDGTNGQDGTDGQDGEDGNANVTVHIFDGWDSTSASTWNACMDISPEENVNSSWVTYLGKTTINPEYMDYYHIPGVAYPGPGEYSIERYFDYWCYEQYSFEILLTSGTGYDWDEVRVVQTLANNTVDHTGNKTSTTAKEDYETYIASFDKDEIEYVYH